MKYRLILLMIMLTVAVTNMQAQVRMPFKDSLRAREVRHFADTLALTKEQAKELLHYYTYRDKKTDSIMRLPILGKEAEKRKALLKEVRKEFNDSVKETLNKKQYEAFKAEHKNRQDLAIDKLKGIKKNIQTDKTDTDNE